MLKLRPMFKLFPVKVIGNMVQFRKTLSYPSLSPALKPYQTDKTYNHKGILCGVHYSGNLHHGKNHIGKANVPLMNGYPKGHSIYEYDPDSGDCYA